MSTSGSPVPRILVSVHTSGPRLSKSGSPPFTVILRASMDKEHPVTIDAFMTVLHPRASALDYQGLTFKDIESGVMAKRRVIDVQYQLAETLTAASDSVVTIPPRGAGEPYTVAHTFQTKAPDAASSSSADSIVNELVSSMTDQTVGLELGHTYEIGLGTQMSSVAWWVKGTKSEAFAEGPRSRRAKERPLEMELVSTARFEVID